MFAKTLDFITEKLYNEDMESVKENIAKNIARLRTENGMTQPELAEKLNYTDKSVSKWEHGIATPPIDVLKEIADIFGVTVDDMLKDLSDEYYDKIYTAKENKPNKIIITLLAVSLVWLIAIVLYVYGKTLAGQNMWQIYVYAVPATCVVLLVFNCLWGKRALTFVIISALVWSILTCIYIAFLPFNPWAVFFIGIPLQIATILWSQLKRNRRVKKKTTNNK